MTIEIRNGVATATTTTSSKSQQQLVSSSASSFVTKNTSQTVQEAHSSSSSYGYVDSPSEDDGYYTTAVSVQHKMLSTEQHEVSSEISSSTSEQLTQYGRKVVWPNLNVQTMKDRSSIEREIHHHHHIEQNGRSKLSDDDVDHPLGWMREASAKDRESEIRKRAEQMEMEIQKRTFDIGKSNRISRSRSRSNQIMERARSFDRLAAETCHSNPGSRPPSRARGRRSPSLSRQLTDYWQGSGSRPESRNGFEPPRRWQSVGKIDVTPWECRIRDASPQGPPRPGVAPRRRPMTPTPVPPAKEDPQSKQDFPRGQINAQWPPPPPPPPIPPQPQEKSFPPPPPPMTSSDLSSESIRRLSEEETSKEQIVQEWVRQTSHHQYQEEVKHEEDIDLERFAYDIAETLVSNMEKSAGIQTKKPQMATTSTISSHGEEVLKQTKSASIQVQSQEKTFSGIVRATPAQARYDSEERDREEEDRKKREKEERKKRDEQQRRQEEARQLAKKKEEEMEKNRRRREHERKLTDEKRIRFLEQQITQEQIIPQEPKRSTTPKLIRKLSFDTQTDSKLNRSEQFSSVRTGQVDEKRNFWIRSTSTERLNARHEMSPGPRRRVLHQQGWIRGQDGGDQLGRPGSSLGQVAAEQGNVKQVISSLSKSKSSAAVLQDGNKNTSRARSAQIKTLASGWNNKNKVESQQVEERKQVLQEVHTNQVQDTVSELTKKSGGSGRNTPAPMERETSGKRQARATNLATSWGAQVEETGKSLRYEEVHTNQVQETIQEFGKKSGDSGRNTPAPSRHIGEVFAENKIASDWKKQNAKDELVAPVASVKTSASPWRTSPKSQEPSLKLVNVTVEKSTSGGANIHISENAHAQMASFMQQETKKESKFSSSTSSSTMVTSSSHIEQKSMEETRVAQVPPRSPGPIRKSAPTKDKGKHTGSEINGGHQKISSAPKPATNHVEITEIESSTIHKQEEKRKMESKSTKISSSSSPSSSQIPMPVTQSWFEHQEQQQKQQTISTSVTSSSNLSNVQNSQSVTTTSTTPLPVLAGWFEEEQKQSKQPKVKKSSPEKQVHYEDEKQQTKEEEKIEQTSCCIIELSDQENASLENALKGKVRGNVAIFQQPGTYAKSPSGGNIGVAQEVESMKGKVGESKKAYIQRASSSDREEGHKQQRAKELEDMLRARNESGSRAQETDDPEKLFAQRQKEERARELEEVAKLRATTTTHNIWEDTNAHERAELSRLQRAKELQEISSSRSKKKWNDVVAGGGQSFDEDSFDEELVHESEKNQRAKELQEISNIRSKKNWSEVSSNEQDLRACTKTPDPELELDEAKQSIRSAAMVWQERDKATNSNRYYGSEILDKGSPMPSRRIGNLFSKNSDHWQMQDYDEEFPAPPTAEDFGPVQPPPPPRDSSKDFMMEYTSTKGSNGHWSKH